MLMTDTEWRDPQFARARGARFPTCPLTAPRDGEAK
jgi:hypothetical protein